ncbi:MAG: hypothetical protein V2J55_06850 [Candidatus Competibacteraceae bacterium]|jgi:hypothetical protein|nr:hypothetical protein [Candidatus Competibacteraceae bacterium]
MLSSIPLFLFLLIGYNVIIFIFPSIMIEKLFTVSLISGAYWSFDVRDLLLVLGLFSLYIEILRATRYGTASMTNHMLSIVTFAIFLVEFITVPQLGTSTFFLLMVMALIDVIAGFTVTVSTAHRGINISQY